MGNQNKVGGFSTTCIVTPVVSTSPAYSSNDQVGGILTLVGACQIKNSLAVLESVTVIDRNSQNAAYTIFFFDTLPTVASVDNATLNISDAEMVAKCIGAVSISNTNYQTTSANSVGTLLMPSCALALRSLTANGDLFAVVKTLSTPTFATTSDLTFKLSFSQDL